MASTASAAVSADAPSRLYTPRKLSCLNTWGAPSAPQMRESETKNQTEEPWTTRAAGWTVRRFHDPTR